MFGEQFYPTPEGIAAKMLVGIDYHQITTILEPSAGKGDLAGAVVIKHKEDDWRRDAKPDIDCIEIDPNLRHVLKGKKYRVVHDDFLNYATFKRYDLIVMNPPFAEGDKHLLKALEMQKQGGLVVCLLNAETLKNPYTNSRQKLVRLLDEYAATVTYLTHAFASAERKTDVEIALVRVDIPAISEKSTIIEGLREAYSRPAQKERQETGLIDADFLKAIVQRYTVEVHAGIRLLEEYRAYARVNTQSLREDKNPILKLEVDAFYDEDNYRDDTLENALVRRIRAKYWELLFKDPQFMGMFTTNIREEYLSRINELRDYEFSIFNICSVRMELDRRLVQSVEETILALFEELTHEHTWYPECKKNIHYFDGWATNKAYKINKKVIIPLRGYYNIWGNENRYAPDDYNVARRLGDIEKVLNYLDGGLTTEKDLSTTLTAAKEAEQTKDIVCKYFSVTFYKKGTCHITFMNTDLLAKFNLYGCQRKGWLPPCYGKKAYSDMTDDEQAVINVYEGKDAYAKVLARKDYYIATPTGLPALAEASGI